jgi:2-C-methyl-D-erythritol 2,4-cyclodiphosphate synthase
MRVGVGYDSHRFAPARPLVLGGVTIPADRGLAGHSDADAVAHAVTDALLGAAGLGDMGVHFPSSDERWKDADSLAVLGSALLLVEELNYQVVNVDVTIICETVRLAGYLEGMRANLAAVLDIASSSVSVKVKSNDGMGWVGRGEGVATLAVALVDRIDSR